jgi:hypothetical protein
MNKVLTRLQALRDKAAQFKQVVDSAPAKAAQLRDAVNATTGRLQQLRADVQGTVESLRADSDASLAQTLVELDGGIGTLARAGYELTGVDIEQGPLPRVIVHLDQVADARSAPLEMLVKENAGRRTLQAILNALIRAEAMEDSVHLADLTFRGLIIHIGPVPTVRLCWRRALVEVEEPVRPHSMEPVQKPSPMSPASPSSLSGFGSSPFFERRAPVPPPLPASATPQSASTAPEPTTLRVGRAVPPEPEPVESTGDWRKDALARFKKMPDLSKRR